jgi:hypothetical protein
MTKLHYCSVVYRHSTITIFSFLSESEESDHDDQCLGGTGKHYLTLTVRVFVFVQWRS